MKSGIALVAVLVQILALAQAEVKLNLNIKKPIQGQPECPKHTVTLTPDLLSINVFAENPDVASVKPLASIIVSEIIQKFVLNDYKADALFGPICSLMYYLTGSVIPVDVLLGYQQIPPTFKKTMADAYNASSISAYDNSGADKPTTDFENILNDAVLSKIEGLDWRNLYIDVGNSNFFSTFIQGVDALKLGDEETKTDEQKKDDQKMKDEYKAAFVLEKGAFEKASPLIKEFINKIKE